MVPRRVVLLSGGLGGARLAPALARLLGPGRLTVVANVGDDLDWHGLRVCPDLDAVLYALAGRFDLAEGWGVAGDTFTVASVLGDLALAENLIRAGQAACSYSLRIPPRRWCRRMSRRAIWSRSVIG